MLSTVIVAAPRRANDPEAGSRGHQETVLFQRNAENRPRNA
jgi:hypothetical protein